MKRLSADAVEPVEQNHHPLLGIDALSDSGIAKILQRPFLETSQAEKVPLYPVSTHPAMHT